MVSPKTPEEMLEESTSRVSTTGRHTKTSEEAGEIGREGKEEMEEVEEGAEILTLKLSHSRPHNRCAGMSLPIRGKWRSKMRSQPLQEPLVANLLRPTHTQRGQWAETKTQSQHLGPTLPQTTRFQL